MQGPLEFKFGVLTTSKTSSERQIKEAIYIQSTHLDILLNSKGEWGLNIIPQLKVTEGGDLVDDQLAKGTVKELTITFR